MLTYVFDFFFLRQKERERERTNISCGGAERQGDRGSKAGSVLTPENPVRGLNSQMVRS